MSIIDDLCASLSFRESAREAVKEFFQDNHQEEIHGKRGGTFDADVTKATVSLDEVKPDTIDGLSAAIALAGRVVLEVQYMDEDGDDQERTVEGTFDGSLSVEFPYDLLASDDRDALLSNVAIEDVTLKFSAYDMGD
ncbi:hypothetical protein [Caballeronia sp. GAFFF2]|uniref:hypothetical protein n=1 Tax=Caballeronia sp. GAFFF2 TaxID=2921741 RepID=UPI002027A76E|nr:hypothetical protein [Caballeronia sp. GAFFF2]